MPDNTFTLSHRPIQPDDLPLICSFPRSEQELFMLFPKATYPLTPSQLQESINARLDPTVVLCGERVVGFANLYQCEPDRTCWIGNVVVDPDLRGKGIGTYLINTMIGIAVQKYRVKTMELFCMSHNVAGLFLYTRLGFSPTRIEERVDRHGNRIATIHMIRTIAEPGA
ncbi:MAG: GNAT family N-acetyltransferase [Chloroflexi bacterium]|nr:GNAT family N-acetyltransferase [Chloroflexota bacterium]BCY17457.1 N-acetyltransferase [Leptolinea sp. HRD-7]